MTGIAAVNTTADLHRIPIVQQGAQVGVIHLVQKIGGELFQIFIHRSVIVDDDVKHLTAAGLNGQKLLVGILAVPGVLLPNSCGSKHKQPSNSSGTTPDQQPLQILGFPCGCSRFHTGSFFFHYRRFLVRNPGAAYQEPVGVDPIGSAGDEGTQVLTGDDT